MYKLMTPGPTQVAENVRMARSLECTNPDIDESFVEFYKNTCLKISKLLNTDKETIILGGEGILALEAACASLIEPGDKVLVIDNGIYGRGFADFAAMYGGIPELYTTDYRKKVDVAALAEHLKKKSDYKIATLVHCDTPTGMLNDVSDICKLLKSYGILTIVDAVSSMFGEKLAVDDIDIICGGSQKVISAPPGLCFNVISDAAKQKIINRKVPIASFYANLKVFFSYYEDKWFPYTMPISDINGLAQAIDNIINDPGIYERHEEAAAYTRAKVKELGLKLFAENGYSNTVTVFEVPEGLDSTKILQKLLLEYNIMIAGAFDQFKGKLLRIGHMGCNATKENVIDTMNALAAVIKELSE